MTLPIATSDDLLSTMRVCGFGLTEIADRLCVNPSTITNWRANRTELPRYLALALIEVLAERRRELDRFIGDEIEPFVAYDRCGVALTYRAVVRVSEMSQRRMSDILGHSKNTIGCWVADNRRVNPEHAEKLLSDLTGLDVLRYAPYDGRLLLDLLLESKKIHERPFTGQSLREARLYLGFDQRALSRLLGTSASTISNYERAYAKSLTIDIPIVLMRPLQHRLWQMHDMIQKLRQTALHLHTP